MSTIEDILIKILNLLQGFHIALQFYSNIQLSSSSRKCMKIEKIIHGDKDIGRQPAPVLTQMGTNKQTI